ncbi:hypothetical protein [Escherichia coli]|uniref:hypothetical protein n=1 Tax=Escherichia coli TaxID=562 RepID=UPI001BE18A11|nr:hypothetical protein [Escherichia coli]HBD2759348.1 hypothetical protein [Escherichia coli]
MTGKEAIIHYLGTHKSFCAHDVAAVTGATVTSINQAAAKMAQEEKVSTNLIFEVCR